ncbi:pancreatic triacylglycerol lipase-like isoform X2 [Daphnia pulex]|uniref:pancreatic triacylglycerol lipase-like isoform X2 n=1 Tax=Daphnia pulex TaxID=6669 RepID=UPI001EDF64BC|nr:pancreatic triacylglycerol lipase-like isoform X2 [Daphnia pulex]
MLFINRWLLGVSSLFWLIELPRVGSAGTTEELIEEIHFQLFTRENPNEPQILELDNATLLHQSNYNNSLKTKFFAHGLNGSPTYSYPTKDGYLERQDCNFIAIDWSTMATGNYSYVSTNYVPLAGMLTGKFINFLVTEGATLDDFHLIGHSFGAHVVGFAGAAVTSGERVARITGLDPSHTDEFYPLEDTDGRLDTTDAHFVDIIHTEGRFTVPIGHIDFFPNGGLVQPGCDGVSGCCAHCRAVDYFTESITTEIGFRSIFCDSWDNYLSGACDENESVLMGEYVDTSAIGAFYLTTNEVSPFAMG